MSHHVFLAFLDKAHHSLAGLRARRFAQKREAFVEAFDLVFGFGEVLFKTLSQAVESRCLGHFGQRFRQLLLRVENIPELIKEKILNALGRHWRRASTAMGALPSAVGDESAGD